MNLDMNLSMREYINCHVEMVSVCFYESGYECVHVCVYEFGFEFGYVCVYEFAHEFMYACAYDFGYGLVRVLMRSSI